jgi:ferredoxin
VGRDLRAHLPDLHLVTAALHRVTLLPECTTFDAREDRPILRSALEQGVRMLSSCRNGTCRTCLARLVIGRIEYEIEWPGVSADEKVEGLILPCVARPLSDLVIRRGE